ncbi:MAG TPA: hypothetical protein VJ827_03395 [Rubrobacter sp.]|nr:hypothetical protein [Rubrobacter sp.]
MYGIMPFGRGIPPFAVLAVGSGLILFFVLTPFHFFPFFPLLWIFFFLAMRAMWVIPARTRTLPTAGQPPTSDEDRKEQELLEALERRGEITAARAALETSLSVAEADGMLSRLAENGHVQVHARGGRLAYSLWDMDRRGEIEGNSS